MKVQGQAGFDFHCPVYCIPCVLTQCNAEQKCKYQHASAAQQAFIAQSATAVHDQEVSGSNMIATPVVEKKPCHYGMYHIGTIGDMKLWAGREAGVHNKSPGGMRDYALHISLVGGKFGAMTETVPLVGGSPEARALFPASVFRESQAVPQMSIDWPDYGVPELGLDWWTEFAAALAKVDGDVAIYCLGGHGRTGTALSILAATYGWVGRDADPVEWVRAIYCRECVESEEQVEYIEAMTGHEVKAPVSKVAWSHYLGSGVVAGTDTRPQWPPQATASNAGLTQDVKDAVIAYLKPKGLSKNRYKKWSHRLRRQGHQVPTLGELEDQAVVEVDGAEFIWDAIDQRFTAIDEDTGTAYAAVHKG